MPVKQVPQLKRKTAQERGPIDMDSLTAAVRWDVIMDPAIPVDPGTHPTLQRPLESKAQVDSLEIPTLDSGLPVNQKGVTDQGTGAGHVPVRVGARTPGGPGTHLGQALQLAKALLEKG